MLCRLCLGLQLLVVALMLCGLCLGLQLSACLSVLMQPQRLLLGTG
jgi:hypothetical protein